MPRERDEELNGNVTERLLYRHSDGAVEDFRYSKQLVLFLVIFLVLVIFCSGGFVRIVGLAGARRRRRRRSVDGVVVEGNGSESCALLR